MSKHTPGPWRLVDWSHQPKTNRVFVEGPHCEVLFLTKKEDPNRVANARLGTAAPELLQELRLMVIQCCGSEKDASCEKCHRARLVIDKAMGKDTDTP